MKVGSGVGVSGHGPRVAMSGFTMIEVLIAILVLGVGLLGMAVLQTSNLRFTQSAHHRTVATNLSHELIDTMRVNRALVAQYSALTAASFATVEAAPCPRAGLTPAENMERWRCLVREHLPNGTANVVIPGDGTVTVQIFWGDERWVADSEDVQFNLTTRL